MLKPKAYIEISPLFEQNWTGIPTVAGAIVEGAIDDKSIDWTYIYENIPIPAETVRRFISQWSGADGLSMLAQHIWRSPPVSLEEAKTGVCIYTNIKPMRNYFGREASILYDLSPIVTPQFHNEDNIRHFANRIRFDIQSADHLFGISQAVLNDVRAYFPEYRNSTSLIPMGVRLDPVDVAEAMLGQFECREIEPFIVVLGTLEPRKNGSIVLKYAARNREFLRKYRLVYIGRDGWLDEKQRLLEIIQLAGIDRERVVFAGHVTEALKTALLLNSRFCIYPSFFEGYGLPILEANVLGKFTVCSNSSSMPEVSPDSCSFFDPTSLTEFGRAVKSVELRAQLSRSEKRSVADIMLRASAHSWRRCYESIAAWVKREARSETNVF